YNAALFELPLLRYPDPVLSEKTVHQTYEQLRAGSEGVDQFFIYRYRRADDFGTPKSPFVLCSFWWFQALARLGQLNQAREALRGVFEAANPLGLFAEHDLPSQKTQLGNFPQAYSHIGQINATFAVSPPWSSIL